MPKAKGGQICQGLRVARYDKGWGWQDMPRAGGGQMYQGLRVARYAKG